MAASTQTIVEKEWSAERSLSPLPSKNPFETMAVPMHGSFYRDVDSYCCFGSSPKEIVDRLFSCSAGQQGDHAVEKAKQILLSKMFVDDDDDHDAKRIFLTFKDPNMPEGVGGDIYRDRLLTGLHVFVPKEGSGLVCSSGDDDEIYMEILRHQELCESLEDGSLLKNEGLRDLSVGVHLIGYEMHYSVYSCMDDMCRAVQRAREEQAIPFQDFSVWVAFYSRSSGRIFGFLQFHRAHRLRDCNRYFDAKVRPHGSDFGFRSFLVDVLWSMDEKGLWESMCHVYMSEHKELLHKVFCEVVQQEGLVGTRLRADIKELLFEIGEVALKHGLRYCNRYRLYKLVKRWQDRRFRLALCMGRCGNVLSEDTIRQIYAMSGVGNRIERQFDHAHIFFEW